MARQKKPTIPAELLEALHYTSAEEAALDMLLLSAQSRYAEFTHEVQQFEAKYQMDFAVFQRLLETRGNEEDFVQEEELMAWKFVQDAADYWRQKTEELKLLELARRYADIIQTTDVERFRVVGSSYECRAIVRLKDGSLLFVKDYLFLDGTRKYAYHWQDHEGQLRYRWDNVPHWPEVTSHPHQQHVGRAGGVTATDIRTFDDVLRYIREYIQRP